MRVLSIDFDYFQKTDSVTLMSYFPAPYDYSMGRAAFEWTILYGNEKTRAELEKVSIMETEFEKACRTVKALGKRKPGTPNLITNSHGAIFEFINEAMEDDEEELIVTNVDMHHDLFGENGDKEANCANWGNVLQTTYKNMKFTWVKNPLASGIYRTELANEVTTDLDAITEQDYDMLFLCRSDNFSVPHLDKYFRKLWTIIDDNYDNMLLESDVNKIRAVDKDIKAFMELEQGFTNKFAG